MTTPIGFADIIRSEGGWALKRIKLIDLFFGTFLAFILPSQKSQEHAPGEVKKILIIRPGGIGDAVFLLPILKILREQSISFDIICEKRNAEVFISQGYGVYIYTDFKQLFSVLQKSYDVVIDTEQWHYLSALVSYFVKAPYKIGFSSRLLRAKLFNKRVSYDQNGYELDNFIALFDDLIVSTDKPRDINNCFDIPQSLQAWAQQQSLERSICLFLGGSIPLRRFSEAQLKFIIQEILSKDCHVVLLGGNDVESLSRQILGISPDNRILNFVGKISLLQSAALIKRSQKFIGPDSGLMHLACAAGTPVIAVFGPGNLNKWKPQGLQHKIISNHVPCSPCTRFGYTVTTCHKTYICVRDIQLKGEI